LQYHGQSKKQCNKRNSTWIISTAQYHASSSRVDCLKLALRIIKHLLSVTHFLSVTNITHDWPLNSVHQLGSGNKNIRCDYFPDALQGYQSPLEVIVSGNFYNFWLSRLEILQLLSLTMLTSVAFSVCIFAWTPFANFQIANLNTDGKVPEYTMDERKSLKSPRQVNKFQNNKDW